MNVTNPAGCSPSRTAWSRWAGVLISSAISACVTTVAAEAGPGKVADMAKGYTVEETVLTRADSGRTVDLRVGDRLLIRLDESPTTGFAWTGEGGDDTLVQQASDFAPTSTAFGGGGLRSFLFMAEQAGVAELRLRLWRAWEGDSSVVGVFTVTARIRER